MDVQGKIQQYLTLPECEHLVSRHEQLDLFTQAIKAYPLVLLQAPSGFGKTVLLRELVDNLQHDHQLAYQYIHFSQPTPNEIQLFWPLLIIAIKRFDYGLGEKLDKDWQSLNKKNIPEDEIRQALLKRLNNASNSIHCQGQLLLLLDNCQQLDENTIHQDLLALLEHQPKWIKLVLSSQQPLDIDISKRLAQGKCQILNSHHISFNPNQAEQLFGKELLQHSPFNKKALFDLTLGWPGILNLLKREQITEQALTANAHHMQTHAAQSEKQTPSLNFTPGTINHDYVVQHILSSFNQSTQDFLKWICPLTNFNLPLLVSLTASNNSDQPWDKLSFSVKTEFQQLHQLGLLIAVEQQNFKLHPILKQFYWQIHYQGNPVEISVAMELQKLAREQFLLEDNEKQALQISLDIQDWPKASNLALKTSQSFLSTGDMKYIQDLLDRFPVEFIYQQPFLCLLKALIHLSQYEHQQAQLFMDNVKAKIDSLMQQQHELSALENLGLSHQDEIKILNQAHQILRGMLDRFSHGYEKVESNSQAPLFNNQYFLCWQYFGQMVDSFIDDNMNQAVLHGNNALLLAKDVKDYNCAIGACGWLLHALHYQGQVQQGLTLGHSILNWLKQEQALHMHSIHNLYGALCFLCIESNQLDQAWQYFELIKSSIGPYAEPRELLYSRYYLHINLLAASGQDELLPEALDELKEYQASLQKKSQQTGREDFSILFDSELTQSLLELRNKNAFPLMQWAMSQNQAFEDLNPDNAKDTLGYHCPFRYNYEAFLHGLGKSLAQIDMTDQFESLLSISKQNAVEARAISIQLLQARLLYTQNDMTQSIARLSDALSQAKQGGYCHLIIEDMTIEPILHFALEQGIESQYSQLLLEALEERKTYLPPHLRQQNTQEEPVNLSDLATLDHLTPREKEVLLALAQGKRNKELAEELNLSLATVKRHLQNIYGKLHVTSRTEAVLLARPFIQSS